MTTKGRHGHLLRARSAHSEMRPLSLHRSRWTWLREAGFPLSTQQASGFLSWKKHINLPVVCVRSRLTPDACWRLPALWWQLFLRDIVHVLGKLSRGVWRRPWKSSGSLLHISWFKLLTWNGCFQTFACGNYSDSLRCCVLQCHCRHGATDGHILATCAHTAFLELILYGHLSHV